MRPHRDPHPDGRQTIASSTQRGGLMRVLAFEEGTGCDSEPQATSPSKILPQQSCRAPTGCQRSRLAGVANAPPQERQAMTTLGNRPATALLVIDVQNAAVAGSYQRDAVVANIGSLVEKARREHVPVIWVQHSDEELERGSSDWQIVPELNPDGSEPLVEKHYGDSFEETTLENVLSGLRVGRLLVVGAQTDACIRSTLHGAFARGYRSEEHTSELQSPC